MRQKHGYRRIGYLEQIWYILKWKIKNMFRKDS